MRLRNLWSLILLALALALGAASVLGDPRLVSGSECCACLQLYSPEGEQLSGAEYDANCLAAGYLLRSELYTRQDINFMLLVLENNRGPDRPPFQAETLVQCLQEQGLY